MQKDLKTENVEIQQILMQPEKEEKELYSIPLKPKGRLQDLGKKNPFFRVRMTETMKRANVQSH